MFGWFQDSLKGIAKLIQGQIIASKEKKRFVQVRLLIFENHGATLSNELRKLC